MFTFKKKSSYSNIEHITDENRHKGTYFFSLFNYQESTFFFYKNVIPKKDCILNVVSCSTWYYIYYRDDPSIQEHRFCIPHHFFHMFHCASSFHYMYLCILLQKYHFRTLKKLNDKEKRRLIIVKFSCFFFTNFMITNQLNYWQ